jgi:hypothetical protein
VAALWIEKLAASNSFTPDLLLGHLNGNARKIPTLSANDAGAGLVQAPAA